MKDSDGIIKECAVILSGEGKTEDEGWSGKGGLVKLVVVEDAVGNGCNLPSFNHLTSCPSLQSQSCVIISFPLSLCIHVKTRGNLQIAWQRPLTSLHGFHELDFFPPYS